MDGFSMVTSRPSEATPSRQGTSAQENGWLQPMGQSGVDQSEHSNRRMGVICSCPARTARGSHVRHVRISECGSRSKCSTVNASPALDAGFGDGGEDAASVVVLDDQHHATVLVGEIEEARPRRTEGSTDRRAKHRCRSCPDASSDLLHSCSMYPALTISRSRPWVSTSMPPSVNDVFSSYRNSTSGRWVRM